MNRFMRTAVEFISPSRIRYPEVPPMELGMTPNDLLDDATDVDEGRTGRVDDVVAASGGLAVAHEDQVAVTNARGEVERFPLPGRITALAAFGSDLLAAVHGHGLYCIRGAVSGPWTQDARLTSNVTALLALPDGSVLATVGSADEDIDGWSADLLLQRATGSLHRIGADGQVLRSREGLSWAAGLAEGPGGPGRAVLVSLAHAHRIDLVDPESLQTVDTFLAGLPSYPWRISHNSARNSWWVSMPLVRSRFTELILGEREFLEDMMATVPQESWYGPSMAGGSIYREPLQLGGLRVFGQVKPWAPPRSYGLVAEYDASGRVLRSLHSRAGGSTHGVVAAAEHEGSLWLAARSRSGLVRIAFTDDLENS